MRYTFLGLIVVLFLTGCTSSGGQGEYMQYASQRCERLGADLGTSNYSECMNDAAKRYQSQAATNPSGPL